MKHYCSRKILMITHQLSRTGAPIALLNVARLLRDEGYAVSLISLEDGPLKDEFEEIGIEVSFEKEILKKWETYISFFKRFDLVFCNTLVTFEAIHVLNYTDVPTVWWIHEPEEYFSVVSGVLPDMAKLKPNIHIWAVSPLNKKYLQETFGVEAELVSLYVDDASGDEGTVDLNEDKIKYLCVGSYSYTKGQDLLIEAIESLDPELLNRLEFYFCGDEEFCDEKYLSPVKKAEENYPVHRLGRLPQSELFKKMSEMDYLICPSRMETVSSVAVEAMMMSLPTLLSDGCGVVEIIGGYEYVFEKENPQAIKDMLEKSVELRGNEKEYSELKRNLRETYESFFSREVYRQKVFELLQSYIPNKRLVFLTGNYDVLDIFTLQLEKAFSEMGYEVLDFNCDDLEESMLEFGSFLQKGPVNAAFTFNFFSTFMELADKKVVWDQYHIPIITYLMDHPFCFDHNLKKLGENSIVLCPDMNHMNYVTRFYPNVPVCGFLGHGGIEKSGEKKPLKDRRIQVLYAGGISAPNVEKILPDFSKYEFDAKRIGDETFDYLCNHPEYTTEEVLEGLLHEHGVEMKDEDLREFIFDMHYVDLQIVSYFREKTVRTLAEAGIPLTLFGFGWESFEWIKDLNVDYRGRVSAYDIIDYMADSKIVLSTMTWFKDGTHDRVFNGQLQGAFAITDTSAYMKEQYRGLYPYDVDDRISLDCAEIGFFDLQEIEKLPGMIGSLLNKTDDLENLAQRGYVKAKQHHSWAERAKELDRDLFLYL